MNHSIYEYLSWFDHHPCISWGESDDDSRSWEYRGRSEHKPLSRPESATHLKMPVPKKIHYRDGHTTVIWSDGTSTTVACEAGETFDKYAGFCAAVCKKLFGSTSQVKRAIEMMDVEAIKAKRAEAAARAKADVAAREAEARARAEEKEIARRVRLQQREERICKAVNEHLGRASTCGGEMPAHGTINGGETASDFRF